MDSVFDQGEYEVRCEWGRAGLERLAPGSDVLVIVDVLSFSTAVDIATGNGALVYPYPARDESAADYARSLGAVLADFRGQNVTGYSLSPASLLAIPAGTRLVLPSPNGSALSRAAEKRRTLTGCLRNARAVARAAQEIGRHISVIPAGERWADGSLRPALEDLLGAGAIIHWLEGRRSPEAQAAQAAFEAFNYNLQAALKGCASGKELIGRGLEQDVTLASSLDCSDCAPILSDGAYVRR